MFPSFPQFLVVNMGIAPSLILDRVDGENVLVYGVALIWGF